MKHYFTSQNYKGKIKNIPSETPLEAVSPHILTKENIFYYELLQLPFFFQYRIQSDGLEAQKGKKKAFFCIDLKLFKIKLKDISNVCI